MNMTIVYVCVCVSVCACLCMCVFLCVCENNMCVHVCMCVQVCVCVQGCVWYLFAQFVSKYGRDRDRGEVVVNVYLLCLCMSVLKVPMCEAPPAHTPLLLSLSIS